MTQLEQLERWLAGESVHVDDVCVPDFSCCTPELRADKATRQAYADAFRIGDNGTCLRLLCAFINAAAVHEGLNVRLHVNGGDA